MNKLLSIFLNRYEKIALNNISWRLAFVNKFYNSILKLNRDGKYMTHYTSNCYGTKNLIIDGDPSTIFTSLAVSAGCYINIDVGCTLEIGEQTIWAPNICIRTGNHDLLDRNKHICESIKIGKMLKF